MLFLAVFCGFLAEYQLEHKIERDRARELAKSFYQELSKDSVAVAQKVRNRLKQEAALRYLIGYFRDSSLTQTSKDFAIQFLYGVNFRSPALFEPRTIMLEQLRNSGSLRYFKNDELQNLTGELTVAIKNVYDRQALESEQRLRYINPMLLDHYDWTFDTELKKRGKNVFDAVEQYEKSEEIIPFHLNSPDQFNRKQAVNILSFYHASVVSSTRQNQLQQYIDINAALLKVLREVYHLK